MTTPLLRSVDDLTGVWLTHVLGQTVRSFTVKRVGEGQSRCTYRINLDWDGGFASVILKLADTDPAVRRTGMVTGHSQREVHFYEKIASRLPAKTLAHCHAAVYDAAEGYFTLLFEDLVDAQPGDQIACCSVDSARLAVRELARLVASVVEDPDLASWVDTPLPLDRMVMETIVQEYYKRFGNRISAEQRDVIGRFAACFDTWVADRSEPRSIVHNDFRLDNMLFGEPGAARELTIIDWATLRWGSVCSDLAYFLGGNLSPEDRRTHEKELVRHFHDELVAHGVADFSFEECWRGYRWMAFAGVLMAVGAPMVVAQTERGDAMFLMMLTRHCQQVKELDAIALLDEAHRENLKVNPADEGRHEPGNEPSWNESWYMDAISADGKLGAYIRMGYVPNQNRTVYTAYIVGEGRPAVAILDYDAPLPGTGLALQTERFTSAMIIEEPLQRFRATLNGVGESYVEAAAALRGERGEPVAVAIDLVWETEGLPYQYQITSRYELPCRVTGTVRVGDEVLTLTGPGQRDHSWGERNWWSHDWTWASAHLDDGSRIQAVELRLPGMPVVAFGYEQRGSELTEISAMNAAYTIPADRQPGRTTALLGPSGTQLEWESIAQAPIRLVAPDGRVCEFPRAMARVRTPDGRTGLGWLEWGHNVDPTAKVAPQFLRDLGALASQSAKKLLERVPQEAFDGIMNSRAGRHIVRAIFQVLPKRMDERRAQIVNATVRFNISDAASGATDSYDLILRLDGAPRIERQPAGAASLPEARLSLTLSGADLLALGTGRLDPMQAALQRRIVLEGDRKFLAVLAPLLAGGGFPAPLPLTDK